MSTTILDADELLVETTAEESALILLLALEARGARFALGDDGFFRCDLDRCNLSGFPAADVLARMVLGPRDQIRALLHQRSIH